MTREEAIVLLNSGREGVRTWNNWREQIPDADLPNLEKCNFNLADLRDANLSELQLSHSQFRNAQLPRANLSAACLHMADFISAYLGGANLSRADLSHAKFSGAYLSGADFKYSNLSSANLVGASLRFAILTGAILELATFNEVRCNGTVFSNTDLSGVIGIEEVRHTGPSTVGIDTLYRSKGKISERFLKDCGVPAEFITFLSSLINAGSSIQYYSCFISHSSKDKEFVERLYSRMRDEGLRVWYAPEDLKPGRKLFDQFEEAIRFYDKLLIVLSEKSIGSEWVNTEIYTARQREVKENRQILFPIRLCSFDTLRQWKCPDADTGKDTAREIREFYIPGDFADWKNHDAFEKAFAKLLKGLKATEKP